MKLPEFDWKIIGIIIIVLFVVLSFLTLNPFQPKTINTYFSPSGVLAPGQSTTLKIEVTNTLGKDATHGSLSVNAINTDTINVSAYRQLIFPLGKSDRQVVEVPLTVSPSALDGTYSLDIAVELDSKRETTRAAVEVKS